ncbi:MAG: arginine--tRNA ligase [Leptospirales bacterium]|nr:arginine--tRNA ligase [Leptospirales bacterium]
MRLAHSQTRYNLSIKEIIHSIIKKSIENAITDNKLPDIEYPAIKVEYPRETKFGDYSTPIALESAKLLKRSPMEIGEILIQYIKMNDDIAGLVELSKPGFINIFISANYLKHNMLRVINERDNYGKSLKDNPVKYNIEFVSANPTGPMNVVSARAAALGDSIANLIEAAGDLIDREFYINDFGNQVDLLGESVLARIKEIKGETFTFPEDGYHGEYIKDIAKWIIDNFDDELSHINEKDERKNFLSKKAVEYNVGNQKKDLEDFNVFFKTWFRESSLHEKGEVGEALKKLEESGHIRIEDGKKIFKSTQFKDDKDRVVVRDDGRPTYLMADIAYHYDKLERGYDYLINIWGPDHHGYIARLSGAVEALSNKKDILRVLISQQVNLIMEGETVKMSKRLGNFSTMRELIDEVGVDVSRFFFIMRSMDSHLDFDLALAKKNSSENPVFYLQYAHARICSIFREAAKRGITQNHEKITVENLGNNEALTILKLLARFPEEIADAAETFEPHKISTYLMRLAQSYHRFYTEQRVISDDELKTQTNLALCDAVRITIKNGLRLLGVSAPESM